MDEVSAETQQAWINLMRAQRRLLGAIEARLKAAGHPPLAWYDLLLELRGAGPAGLRPLELESRLLLAQPNVSRLAERVAAAGYLERLAHPSDGRGQVLRITQEGQARLRLMWPVYSAALRQGLEEKLGGDAATLAALLARIDG